MSSLALERYCVLYNLGVLYNQLATLEKRSEANSVKQATNFYQVRILAMNDTRLKLLDCRGDIQHATQDGPTAASRISTRQYIKFTAGI